MNEKRCFQTELRLADSGRLITGTAIVYSSRSQDLGGFVEVVAPGALAKTLRDNQIKLLFDHDTAFVLGSVPAGTLSLKDTQRGLDFSCEAPETTWANDLLVSMKRGDINNCSFGFDVVTDKWEKRDGLMVRTLQEIKVSEISIVAFPAYTASTVSVRTKEQFQGAVDALAAQELQQKNSDSGNQQKLTNLLYRRLELAEKQ